jgi:hypothetical protein
MSLLKNLDLTELDFTAAHDWGQAKEVDGIIPTFQFFNSTTFRPNKGM